MVDVYVLASLEIIQAEPKFTLLYDVPTQQKMQVGILRILLNGSAFAILLSLLKAKTQILVVGSY